MVWKKTKHLIMKWQFLKFCKLISFSRERTDIIYLFWFGYYRTKTKNNVNFFKIFLIIYSERGDLVFVLKQRRHIHIYDFVYKRIWRQNVCQNSQNFSKSTIYLNILSEKEYFTSVSRKPRLYIYIYMGKEAVEWKRKRKRDESSCK